MTLTIALGRAQPTAPRPAGMLGHRYGEISYGQQDVGDDLFDRKSVGAFQFNFPVSPVLDLGFGGAARRTNGSTTPGMLSPSADIASREWAAHITATAYLRRGVIAPFLRASGEYEWIKQERVWSSGRFGPGRVDVRDDRGAGRFGVGAEVLVKRVAVTPSLHYQESYRNVFGDDLGSAWRVELSVQLWLTRSLGSFLRASRTRPEWDFAEPVWSGDVGVHFGF